MKHRVNYGDTTGCAALFIVALPVLFFLFILGAATFAAQKATVTEMTLEKSTLPPISVISLWNQPGIPEGWIDSTTREDATDICNKLIASQSKEYANAISRSRCIIQVQE